MSTRAITPVGLIALLLVSMLVPAARCDEEAFEKAEGRYLELIARPPLGRRLGGINALAATGDVRALEILAKRYRKPRVPKDHEQYLIAWAVGRYLSRSELVEPLLAIVEKNKDESNAWLWFQALRASAKTKEATAALAIAGDKKGDALLRAAALEALAEEAHPAALDLVADILHDKLARKTVDRVVVLESCAPVVLAHRDAMDTPPFRRACHALIDLLELEDVPDRSKLTIARHLAALFDADCLSLDPRYWRWSLNRETAEPTIGHTVEGRPSFCGLAASGERIAFLLDLSDSMLEPLTEHEIREAHALAGALVAKGEKVEVPPLHCRFDLARAYLAKTIRQLPSDVSVMVVGYGDRAEPFRSTKGLVKASRGTVKEVLAELADIEPGRVTRRRPHGTLRGNTNLHGALLQAYRATTRKSIDHHEHVDAKALMEGCDTVFVFGDGQPTKDDFDAMDEFGGGKITTDREKGETGSSGAGSANYFGPYRQVQALLGDVRRLNLYRKAEIHTIAIGEADNALMRRMADLGLGRYRSFGILGRGGRINTWWLLGPFPAEDVKSWSTAEAPEEHVDVRSPVHIGERNVRWKRAFTSHKHAVVNLERELGPADHACAYAYAEIVVEAVTSARLKIGSDDGVRVWLNGKVVHDALVKRKLKIDEDSIALTLRAGTNRLLLKICDDAGPWSFCARLTDPEDRPLEFLIPQD